MIEEKEWKIIAEAISFAIGAHINLSHPIDKEREVIIVRSFKETLINYFKGKI